MKAAALHSGRRIAQEVKLEKGPRIGPAAAAVRDSVYIFGGAGKDGFRTDINQIDGAAGDNPTLTPYDTKLMPRLFMSAAAVGDDIYLIGGLGYNGVTDTVEKFNVKTREVTKCAPMRQPRRNMGAVVSGSFIFVVGGSDNEGKGVPTLAVYNTKRDTWDTAPPMSVGRESCAALWNGLMIVPGGYTGKTALAICEAYSILQARWTRLPDLPMATSANHCAVVGDRLHSFGDFGNPDRVLALDFRRSRWSQAQTKPAYRPSRHNAVVALGKRVYVIGGNVTSADNGLDTVQVLTVD